MVVLLIWCQIGTPIFRQPLFKFNIAHWWLNLNIFGKLRLYSIKQALLQALCTLLEPLSSFLDWLFLFCSLLRISRQRCILAESRGPFLNMDIKQAHSECTKGSVMISLMTMVKNRLKYSATSAITIIIKQSLQTDLISSITIYYQMKGKPLINEANLHKISKTQQFLVRSKTNLLKSQRIQKSQKIIEPDAIPTEFEYCSEFLQSFLQEGKQITRQQGERLYKLLTTLKNRSSLLEGPGHQEDLEDSPLLLIRHSESKFFGKMKNQTLENKSQQSESHQKLVIQQSKIRPSKMKFGKQNGSKGISITEMKIDRLQLKLTQQQKLIEQYKDKVNSLNSEIQHKSTRFQQLQAENQRLSHINSQFHHKITTLMKEKFQNQQNLSLLRTQVDTQVKQLNQTIKVLRERLQNRQMELVSLFRKHL